MHLFVHKGEDADFCFCSCYLLPSGAELEHFICEGAEDLGTASNQNSSGKAVTNEKNTKSDCFIAVITCISIKYCFCHLCNG